MQASRWRNSHPTWPPHPKTNIFKFLMRILQLKIHFYSKTGKDVNPVNAAQQQSRP